MTTSDLNPKEFKGLFFIRDTIRYRGRTPTLQAVSDHVGFKSRRSAMLLIERLIKKGYLSRTAAGGLRVLREPNISAHAERTIELPLVGTAPCGVPLLAEENVEAMIPVSQKIARPGANYFIIHASGTSMNQAGINDGDLVVVRQQPIAENGDRVVALIDDEVTIKVFLRRDDTIVLSPRSTDKKHRSIILDRDFMIQGVVIAAIPSGESN
jgi:repressor LexA